MRKWCVLLAEDDADQRELFTLILEMNGFEVHSVADGKEALDELQRTAPDLILTDIGMPRIDGLELVKLVKQREELAHVPIIVMTSFGGGYLTWAWAAGANGMLAKPFAEEELCTTIAQFLPAMPDA